MLESNSPKVFGEFKRERSEKNLKSKVERKKHCGKMREIEQHKGNIHITHIQRGRDREREKISIRTMRGKRRKFKEEFLLHYYFCLSPFKIYFVFICTYFCSHSVACFLLLQLSRISSAFALFPTA